MKPYAEKIKTVEHVSGNMFEIEVNKLLSEGWDIRGTGRSDNDGTWFAVMSYPTALCDEMIELGEENRRLARQRHELEIDHLTFWNKARRGEHHEEKKDGET